MTPPRIRRRTFALATAALVAGCASPPPPAPPPPPPAPDPRAAKVEALRGLGFRPAEDGGWELSLGVKLLFETDVDRLTDSGRSELRRMADALAKVGVNRARVEGHTDNVGSAKYNRALSMRRAESVAQQLVAAGWQAERIERVGHGFDKPLADNASAEGRAQNRRVVVTVRAD